MGVDGNAPIWDVGTAMIADSEDELIATLHEGSFEADPWKRFLERLRQAVHANYAGMIFRPADQVPGGVMEIYSGMPASDEVRRDYAEGFYRLDPIMNKELVDGRVYDISHLLDEQNNEHALYRQRILEARNIRYLKVVRIAASGGVTGWLFIARNDAPFDSGHEVLLGRCAFHLKHALGNYLALENERARARVADGVMGRLNIGWLTLDVTGTVVGRSDQANALLGLSASLRISQRGKLVASRPVTNAVLKTAIASLTAGEMRRPQVIALPDEPWLYFVLAPFVPSNLSVDRTAVIIAYLQGDIGSLTGRHEQLAQLFGLLPSEARMALLISQGASIAEAADAMAITIESARSYTRRIYGKMGIRGQADLVRTILTSVLSIV